MSELVSAAALINWATPFDDLTLGQEFTTRGRTITEADVVNFASLSGDWHPLHTDSEWAQAGPFGERIAHGLLTLSIAGGLVPFDPGCVIALRRFADVTFRRPVLLGDTIYVTGKVKDLTPINDEAGKVEFAWQIINQRGEGVCRAKVELIWRRMPALAPVNEDSTETETAQL